MAELSRHIGSNTDVPAGDIGVGGREVAYLFGAYKKIRNEFTGILTGKGAAWGGSLIRPEATGYGLIYYLEHMLANAPTPTSLKDAKVLISGSGNVAQYAALKVLELGGNVLSLSDSKGSLVAVDGKGFNKQDIEAIAQIKLSRAYLTDFVSTAEKGRFEYHAGEPQLLLPNLYVQFCSSASVFVACRQASLDLG